MSLINIFPRTGSFNKYLWNTSNALSFVFKTNLIRQINKLKSPVYVRVGRGGEEIVAKNEKKINGKIEGGAGPGPPQRVRQRAQRPIIP